eukprot:2427941-Pyramimonas_sp.AAC.1
MCFQHSQELHGWRAGVQNVPLVLAPHAFLLNVCNHVAESYGWRPRTGAPNRLRIVRAQSSR